MTTTDAFLPPACFTPEPRSLPVDTIVIHHTSALYWSRLTADDHARIAAAGAHLPDVAEDERKYHPAYCRVLLVIYKVSYNYMVDRAGQVYRLVDDRYAAHHAGVSKMPTDGRERVNDFSIGVSLIASHPADDPDVSSGRLPAYTTEQYSALRSLITDLRARHPIRFIVGHNEIAPGRKSDPSELFDWSGIRGANFSPW